MRTLGPQAEHCDKERRYGHIGKERCKVGARDISYGKVTRQTYCDKFRLDVLYFFGENVKLKLRNGSFVKH